MYTCQTFYGKGIIVYMYFLIALYLLAFAFLIKVTLSNVKLAQIVVPIAILIIVFVELIGIMFSQLIGVTLSQPLLEIGALTMMLPVGLISGVLFSADVSVAIFAHYHIFGLLFFYLPLLNFYLLLIVYCRIVGLKKSVAKFCLGVPIVYLLTVFFIVLISPIYNMGWLVIPILPLFLGLAFKAIFFLFDTASKRIQDKHIKRWFYIAFFVSIIGSILFLIRFRNTEIARVGEAEGV